MKKTIKAWAVVMRDDGFLPDLHHPNVGNLYHICSDRISAHDFVRKAEGTDWVAVECTITYTLPTKPKKI